MADKRTEVIIGYKTDQASAKKAIADSAKVGGAIADVATVEIDKAVRASSQSVNEAYDEVNKSVALAGDVASNAAQVGGALRALGADFAGDALEGLVILGDVTEGLPRLKAAVKGLPEVFGGIVSSIGVGGIGVVGGIGLLVGALTLLSNASEEARKNAEAYAKAELERARVGADIAQLLESGDVEGATQRIVDANLELEKQYDVIARLTDDRSRILAENEAKFGDTSLRLVGGIGTIGVSLSQLDPRIEALDAELVTLNTELDTISASAGATYQAFLEAGFSIDEINILLADNAKANEDASIAVSALTTALLEQAGTTRNRYLEEISLLDQSDEALKDRQKAIQDEITATQKAIDVLKASGDTSKEVTDQIAKYEQANAELGKTLEFIGNTALPNATARAQAEAQRADTEQTQKDIITATKNYNESLKTINDDGQKALLDIETKRTDELLSITKKYADETAGALNKLNADLAGLGEKYTQDELKARTDSLNAELDATRAHYDSLEDISVGAKRDEQDALRNLDFKGAFEARRNANRAIADEQKKFTRDTRERNVNLERDRKERLDAYAQAQSDAQANYQKELQLARQNRDTALQEARANFQKEQNEARNAQATKLRDLQNGYAQEIALANQTSAQRIAIEARTNATILAQAQALLASLSAFRPAGSGFRPTPFSPNRPTPNPNTGNRGGGAGRGGDRSQIIVNGAGNPRRTAEQIQNLTGRGGNGGARR